MLGETPNGPQIAHANNATLVSDVSHEGREGRNIRSFQRSQHDVGLREGGNIGPLPKMAMATVFIRESFIGDIDVAIEKKITKNMEPIVAKDDLGNTLLIVNDDVELHRVVEEVREKKENCPCLNCYDYRRNYAKYKEDLTVYRGKIVAELKFIKDE